MAHTDQLAIPAAARQDARSFELLRVWIAKEDQHVSLRAGAWKDPAAWGIVLADLAAPLLTLVRPPIRRGLIGSRNAVPAMVCAAFLSLAGAGVHPATFGL